MMDENFEVLLGEATTAAQALGGCARDGYSFSDKATNETRQTYNRACKSAIAYVENLTAWHKFLKELPDEGKLIEVAWRFDEGSKYHVVDAVYNKNVPLIPGTLRRDTYVDYWRYLNLPEVNDELLES